MGLVILYSSTDSYPGQILRFFPGKAEDRSVPELVWISWRRDKSLAPFGNRKTNPRKSSPYFGHNTQYVIPAATNIKYKTDIQQNNNRLWEELLYRPTQQRSMQQWSPKCRIKHTFHCCIFCHNLLQTVTSTSSDC